MSRSVSLPQKTQEEQKPASYPKLMKVIRGEEKGLFHMWCTSFSVSSSSPTPAMTKGTRHGSSGAHTDVDPTVLIPHSFAVTLCSHAETCSWFSGSSTEGHFSRYISMRWAISPDVWNSLHSLNPQRDDLKDYSWGELAKNEALPISLHLN